MPSFHTTRRVRHGALEMFELVADVESYPRFVPLCRALRVHRRETVDGRLRLIAGMEIGYKAIRETFTTRVTCDRSKQRILVEYIDGPFKHLENLWHFHDRDEGKACLVEFHIHYEFRSRALGAIMGGMFDTAFRKFAEAFEERADFVYGKTPCP
ncbi:MAG: type II toxin-antitoxin system RatA family toxin [Beijerinckiaceae bacterium]|nr:type II toxin-antitoxin system RatA family toxin [Beijerinckiaceae bacterium]